MIIPPSSVNMEKAVLCAAMMWQEFAAIFEKMKVSEDWFFYPENKSVFRAIKELREHSFPHDPIAVEHKLDNMGELESMGGTIYIDGILDVNTDRYSSESHMDVLLDLYLKREVILPALNEAQAQLSSESSALDIISELEHNLDKLESFDHLELDKEGLKDKIALRRAEAAAGYMGVDSKWKNLQFILGGYRRGKVCLFGARTSVGKTTIALNEIRYHVAKKENPTPTAFFSLETDTDEIYEQISAEHVGLNLHEYAKGNVHDKGLLAKFEKGIEWYCERPLYVTENGMDIDQLCYNIKYLAQKRKVTLGFVDFIQIIKENHVMMKMTNERSKISYVSKRLFNAFRESHMAGIVLTQLRRDADIPYDAKPETRWKYIPQLHHLKESGSLEEDAYQVVLFCHDPDELNPKSVAEVDILANVLKNKRGATMPTFLHHVKGMQRVLTSSRKIGHS